MNRGEKIYARNRNKKQFSLLNICKHTKNKNLLYNASIVLVYHDPYIMFSRSFRNATRNQISITRNKKKKNRKHKDAERKRTLI